MPLINLNNILYSLKIFRAYVLQIPTAKSNIALLANNTVSFVLTKKEIQTTKKTHKLTQYNNLVFTYNNLRYLDDIYRHLKYQYPTVQKTDISYTAFFTNVFKLIQGNFMATKLTSVVLTRKKHRFKVRLLGLLGYIKISALFSNFVNLWNCKQNINYKNFISLMLRWLHTTVIVYTNVSFINFFFKQKNLKLITKQNKVFYKKTAQQKTLIIFSNENIILNSSN